MTEVKKLAKNDDGTALYYPSIHIENISWLKSSLLYFEKIRRITPKGYIPQDSEELSTLTKAKLVLPKLPEQYKDEASRIFIDKFLPFFESDNAKDKQLIEIIRHEFEDQDLSVSRLHIEKLTPEVEERLNKHIKDTSGDWKEVEFIIGGAYMLSLARAIKKGINKNSHSDLSLVTDNRVFDRLSRLLDLLESSSNLESQENEQGLPEENEAMTWQNVILRLGVEYPDHHALENVTIDSLVKYRDTYYDERNLLRKVINEIKDQASTIQDRDALEDYLYGKRKEYESAKLDYQKSMGCLGITSFTSLMQVSAPAAISSLLPAFSVLPSPAQPFCLGIGIAFSVLSWHSKHQQSYRTLKYETPDSLRRWHYLIALEKDFPKPIDWQDYFDGPYGIMP